MYMMHLNALAWLVWPALIVGILIWTRVYRWYLDKHLKKHPEEGTSWSTYFLRGQAQTFNVFLATGTGIPAAISLLVMSLTLVVRGGTVVHLPPIDKPTYTSDSFDVSQCAAMTVFARVNPQKAIDQKNHRASIVVYGLRNNVLDGQILEVTATPEWTSLMRPLSSDHIRFVVDFPESAASTSPTDTSAPAPSTTAADAGAAKPFVDLSFYCAPKPPKPATQ
jgi:hypothetical protein